MNFNELSSFRLSDAVSFHDDLNPALFEGSEMREDVREQLLLIAEDFIDHLGISVSVEDITIPCSAILGSAFYYIVTKI